MNEFNPTIAKYVLSLFLNAQEIAKISLLCKPFNKCLDTNYYKSQDEQKELHLNFIINSKLQVNELEMQ